MIHVSLPHAFYLEWDSTQIKGYSFLLGWLFSLKPNTLFSCGTIALHYLQHSLHPRLLCKKNSQKDNTIIVFRTIKSVFANLKVFEKLLILHRFSNLLSACLQVGKNRKSKYSHRSRIYRNKRTNQLQINFKSISNQFQNRSVMNSCILMAQIVQAPQLRYTSDNLEIMEMMVQFSSTREGESPSTLKVVAWRNTAKEIQQNYHQGDSVILEGRLGMSTFQRPEGFKEKRAELTVQRIYPLTAGANTGMSTTMETIPAAVNPNFATQPVGASFETRSPEPTFNPSVPAATPTPANNDLGTAPQPSFQPAASPNYEPSTYPAMTQPEDDEIPFMRPVHSRSSWANSLMDFFESEANSHWEGVEQFKP